MLVLILMSLLMQVVHAIKFLHGAYSVFFFLIYMGGCVKIYIDVFSSPVCVYI